jgi:signal transduction histidine kinase
MKQWPIYQRLSSSIRTKLLVAVMLVVLVPLLGTAIYGNWFTGNVIKDEVIRSTHDELQRRAQQIETFLDGINSDVRYLSHLNSLNEYLDAAAGDDAGTMERWRRQMEQDFLIFSSAHPSYYQVRYLDETGQEIARVDTIDGSTAIVPEEALQDKSDRYYFIEGAKLGPGDVYISPLDLNREHGELEQPLHPVIRYVTPVYRGNIFRGVVVVNVEGDELLKFVESPGDDDSLLSMTDQDGYYLTHPDPAKRWGGPTDLNTGESLRRDYPEVSDVVLSGRAGDAISGDRVFIFTPVYYWLQHPERYWVILRVEPEQALLAPLFDFRLTAGLILVAAILVALLLTYLLARNFTEPLVALERGVQKMSRGDFSGQLQVQSSDEIGQLTVAFNEMARLTRSYFEQMDRLQILGMKISSHVDRDEILALITEMVQELLPVEDVTIFCLTENTPDARPVVVAGADGVSDEEREPLDMAALQQSLQLLVGEMITQSRGEQVICYAPLRISTRRRAIVELIGQPEEVLDAWHCKLLSSLMAQGSIALENADLYQRLALQREQLRHLVDELMTAQEEERRMVAYDIHDGLLQYLVATRYLMRNYAAMLEQNPEAAHNLLQEGMDQLAAAINEGRRIIEGMRPTLLDDLGLEAAVREMANGLARRAGWQFTLELSLGDAEIPPNVEIAAFRIVQEALTNAYKYAQGSRVLLRMSVSDDVLTILVRDWGQGFILDEVDADLGHVGLVAMQERARLVGGVCTIKSQAGEGVQVFVRLPLTHELGELVEDVDDTRDHC